MLYALYGFVFGMLIPYLSRRFEKFMPATFAYAIYRIIKPNKKVSATKCRQNQNYRKFFKKYFYRSVLWGIVGAGLSAMAALYLGREHLAWYLFFIWSLLLLTEIDYRMYLLPDIITIPLLLIGFCYAVVVGDWVVPAESAFGALLGYFLPVIASLFLVWKDKDMFGGGDIKLLAAIGAWLGFEKLITVILIAVVIFGFYALIRRQRSGAFGPAIAIAAIAVALYSH